MNELRMTADVTGRVQADTLMRMSPAELLAAEYPFAIEVNGQIWFEEPLFALHEFLAAVKAWWEEGCRESLCFCSMETEDNPLLCFVQTERGWLLRSPWQRFSAEEMPFTTQVLRDAVDALWRQGCTGEMKR